MKKLKLFAFGSALALALAFAGCKTEVSPSTPDEPETPTTHRVIVVCGTANANGFVTVDKKRAKKDESVIITVTPDISYKFDAISVKDFDGNAVSVTTVVEGNKFSFTMPESDVSVSAAFDYVFNEAVTELPAGTTGTAVGATYVNFGDWPQTIKAADVTVDENESVTMGAFTYYKGSNGAWYVKLYDKYKYDKYYKVEPIKWRVLTDNYNGKKLLLAESILINCAYYEYDDVNRTIGGSTVYPNNYKESRVRAYLNGLSYTKKESYTSEQMTDSAFVGKGFLQTAFTTSAQNQIAETTVDNSARSTNPDANVELWNSGNNDYACENTSDKIFLLSEQEVTRSDYGFAAYNVYKGDSIGTTESSRIRMTTDYAMASGASSQNPNAGRDGWWWWLRSPSLDHSGYAREVDDDGDAYYCTNVHGYGAGVVPALCLEN